MRTGPTLLGILVGTGFSVTLTLLGYSALLGVHVGIVGLILNGLIAVGGSLWRGLGTRFRLGRDRVILGASLNFLLEESELGESSMETQLVRPENPLLDYGELPAFDRINASDVVPAMRWLLAALEEELVLLEEALEPTWAGLVGPLERLSDRLGFSWGIVGHLMGVKNSDALRDAPPECARGGGGVLTANGTEREDLPWTARHSGWRGVGCAQCDAAPDRRDAFARC